jgi:hypothetical protein
LHWQQAIIKLQRGRNIIVYIGLDVGQLWPVAFNTARFDSKSITRVATGVAIQFN